MPLPLPDGNACIGTFYVSSWQEYFGTCLTDPIAAGGSYSLKMWVAMTGVNGSISASMAMTLPNTEVVIYGSNTCVPLPLSTTNCPSVAPYAWDVIGSTSYVPSS